MSAWAAIATAEAVGATCAFAEMALRLDGYRLALRMAMAELAREREANLFSNHFHGRPDTAGVEETAPSG